MIRDETPGAVYVKAVRRDNPTVLGRLFPALPMTGQKAQARENAR